MDWQELVASLVSSLAWPSAAVMIAVVFRQEFRALLRRLKSGKLGNAEVIFGEALEAVEDKRLQVDDAATAGESESASALERFRSSRELRPVYADNHFADLAREAERNPHFAILTAWEMVQDTYRDLLRVVRGPEWKERADRKMVPISSHQLKKLAAVGTLGEDVADIYDRLRELRNLVAHGREDPTVGQAVAFVDLADWLADKLGEAARTAP